MADILQGIQADQAPCSLLLAISYALAALFRRLFNAFSTFVFFFECFSFLSFASKPHVAFQINYAHRA
ncbi:MAG: hypothetical protein DIZ78_01610 [endosymbiont of Escarpia spicata]|uniref:Uncharacterized protein n=1 Tax=endosymbiont of Escarpia spicata TaxID=2200908 RepID=A0A370DSJ3_9GAMM|nr:MAG: hypothetical protein DIZ78_01610 [endosymbiont of Escarpia spicata]